ncbi:MAG: MFS transporter [bacterium]|nr:MFS transporter [bacterium]
MLREIFIGKRPSHFKVNPLIKAFIVSECFLWSGWNFIYPIFAVFAMNNIQGGKIEIAASGYSVHLITRVIFELISGKYLSKANENKMLKITILGVLIVTLAYIGFIFTNTILLFFLFYAIAGVGIGIAGPAKGALFSSHIDKDKASVEWGLTDASVFISVALAASLGGFIVGEYGFKVVFIISAILNTASTIPYILYSGHAKRHKIKDPHASA